MGRWSSIAAAGCLAMALTIAGCGSSSKSSSGTSPGASTARSKPVPHSTSSPGGSLKVTATPRFASPPASAPVQKGTVQVAYRNIAIDPDTLKVKVGTTVKWTNYDSVDHNVTSIGAGPQKFASGEFGENGTYSVELVTPGVIHYESTTQPATMNGTIEVVK